MTCFELQPRCDLRGHDPRAAEACADCAAYARILASVEPAPSMPTGLADRLRGIDRSTEAREVLAATISDARRPRRIPESLRRRLRAIPANERASQRTPPRWIADGRWGLAACALLTVALTLAAGDVSARFQATQTAVGGAVEDTRSSWVEPLVGAWIERAEKSVLRPADALVRDGLERVRAGRAAASAWIERRVDASFAAAREQGRVTRDGLREQGDALAEALAAAVSELNLPDDLSEWNPSDLFASSPSPDSTEAEAEASEPTDSGPARTEPSPEGSRP